MVKENSNNLFEGNSLLLKLQNSCNQLYQFRFLSDFNTAKEVISKTKLKTLEKFIGESRKTLESEYPEICDKYNNLVEELKSGNFTPERLEEIYSEAWEVTHPK